MQHHGVRVRLEQFRQARRIHGGLVRLGVAALGVKLSRVRVPSRLRLPLYRSVFGGKYAPLDESEAEHSLTSYRSLNAVFTRGLKPETRPIPSAMNEFLCPCDSTVQDVGRLHRDKLLTAKGIEYTVESLLPGIDSAPFDGGHYAILFLSPTDCHRVFSPQDGQIEELIHVPGSRLLVHPPYQRKEYPVFALNERVIFRLSTRLGPCVLVMIAGWGVGNITLPWVHSRSRAKVVASQRLSTPVAVHRGQWIATFELGSTVILILPPAEGVQTRIANSDKLKYGQPLFTAP